MYTSYIVYYLVTARMFRYKSAVVFMTFYTIMSAMYGPERILSLNDETKSK
jgi:hypothetical protein